MQTYEPNNIENFSQPPIKPGNSFTLDYYPTPDDPPWNWWMAALVWLASIIFIIVIPSIAIVAYVAATGMNIGDSTKMVETIQNDPNAILVNIIAVIPAHLITLALGWMVVTNSNKFSFRETLGWKWGGFQYWHILVILAGFFLLANLLTLIFGEQKNEFLKILQSSRTVVYFVAFMATFTAPIVEELVYRGILYSAFQRSFGIPTAVFLVTLLFALVHVPQYYPSVATIILICLLSLILTLIRVKTSNLLPCIILHTIFNGIQSLILIFEPFLRKFIEQAESPDAAAAIFYLIK